MGGGVPFKSLIRGFIPFEAENRQTTRRGRFDLKIRQEEVDKSEVAYNEYILGRG